MRLHRRTVALAVAAVGALAAAAAATFITEKSGGESGQRKAISAYIDTVDLIQNRMRIELTRVTFAYRDLAIRSGRKRAPAELAAAAATLTRLDQKLIATPAPSEAKRLRTLLIRLIAQQAALTREVQGLAAFTPRFTVLLSRLRAASARFDTSMRAIRQPKRRAVVGTRAAIAAAERAYRQQAAAAAAAQADAVDEYVRATEQLLERLHALTAPAVVAPVYAAQVRALEDVTMAGTRLSAELRATNRTQVAERIRAFRLAGREAGTDAVQRAQIAAIRAYNRRSRAVGATASAVQDELRRLGGALP